MDRGCDRAPAEAAALVLAMAPRMLFARDGIAHAL
jgi:hypothetical protein